MTLKSVMAADVDTVFLDTDEFAESATFLPGASLTGFSASLVIADIDEQFVAIGAGTADQRRATAYGSIAALRSGIAAIEGTARDPTRGDHVTVASGARAGTWFVETAVGDEGGASMMRLRYDQRYEAHGVGAVGATQ